MSQICRAIIRVIWMLLTAFMIMKTWLWLIMFQPLFNQRLLLLSELIQDVADPG